MVQTPALRSVGNIVTGDDVQTQIIINCGALVALLHLLNSAKEGTRRPTGPPVSTNQILGGPR